MDDNKFYSIIIISVSVLLLAVTVGTSVVAVKKVKAKEEVMKYSIDNGSSYTPPEIERMFQ